MIHFLYALYFLKDSPSLTDAERDEIADAAVFLASQEADFINGQTLNVDGGFAAAGLIFDLKE